MQIHIDDNISLRQLQASDAVDIFNTIDTEREYLGRWLPFVEHTVSLEYTQEFVNAGINAPKEDFELVYTIRKENQFIGLIGFKETDRNNGQTEIGYWLSEKHQKQGIVTRSVKALCDYAFNDLNLNKVIIKCAVKNDASKNIPQRLGFKLETIEKDGELLTGNVYTDLEVYSLFSNSKQSFKPISNSETKILILGSLPSDKSIELAEYYGHPRNRFWKIISTITNTTLPETYSEKQTLLLNNGIGVWDVANNAIRKGSLDNDIKDEVPNDINKFIDEHKGLKTICFNGKKSEALFNKYFKRNENLNYISLPSSSPANARITFEDICTVWKQMLLS